MDRFRREERADFTRGSPGNEERVITQDRLSAIAEASLKKNDLDVGKSLTRDQGRGIKMRDRDREV